MGLAEKRALAAFQSDYFETWTQEFKKEAKYEPTIEVDWDSLVAGCHNPDYMQEWFEKVYFTPMIESIKSICADDMGATALKETVTKFVIQNKGDISYSAKWCTFDNGVVTLDHKSSTNVDQIKDRTQALTTLLENNL